MNIQKNYHISDLPQFKGSSKQDIWLVTVTKGVPFTRENASSKISRL